MKETFKKIEASFFRTGTKVTPTVAESVVNKYLALLKTELLEKKQVRVKNFGTFTLKEIPEKTKFISLPNIKKEITIPAQNKVVFKMSKKFFDK